MPGLKRRKLHYDSSRPVEVEVHSSLPAVLSEIDAEIGLRQRLASSVDSRIEWALRLQESLSQGLLKLPYTSVQLTNDN